MSRLGNLLEELTRGFGEGATLGVIKYPQAALRSLVTDETYRDALARTEEERRALESSTPYQLGRLGGSFVPAVAAGGGSIPMIVGKEAAQGAVSGFTANEGMDDALRDTLTGGAVGGAFGLLGGGAQKAGDIARKTLSKNPKVIEAAAKQLEDRGAALTEQAMADPRFVEGVQQILQRAPMKGKSPAGLKVTPRSAAMSGDQAVVYDAMRLAQLPSNPLGVSAETQQAARQFIKGTLPRATTMAKQVEQGVFKAKTGVLISDLLDDAKVLAPYAAGGAAVGGGLSLAGMTPQEASTLETLGGFALLGGGLSMLPQLGNLKFKGLQTLAAALPKQQKFVGIPSRAAVVAAPSTVTAAAANTVVPAGLQRYEQEQTLAEDEELRRMYEAEDDELKSLYAD